MFDLPMSRRVPRLYLVLAQDPEKVVASVFEPCYRDTEPFGGIPT